MSDRLRFALSAGRSPRLFVAVDRTATSERALAFVRSLRQRLDCNVIVAHYDDPATASEIISRARVSSADLIVVGVHRRSTWSRRLCGSVARDLLRHSDIPVLCVGGPPVSADRTGAELSTIGEADDPSTVVM